MEILLIVVIALGIFMLPRLMSKNPERDLQPLNRIFRMTGWMRLAILVSILWPALAAFFMEPWNSQWVVFLYVALGPLVLFWGICWVIWGFRKRRRF